MIRKILSVRNVGKFANYSASGDVEFRKLTVFYAENGRGKTTLASILRSLGSGDPLHIAERKTLSRADPPEVKILLKAGTATFKDGAWDKSLPCVEVFDETFVHDNVHAGNSVEHDHKRNMYRVIVGETGVNLSREVDRLDAAIKEANREIADTKNNVAGLAAPLSPEAFIAMKADEAVDAKIDAAGAKVTSLRRSGEIKARAVLKIIDLPPFPADYLDLLVRDVEGISREAEQAVKAHIRSRLGNGGEMWLAQGLAYAADGSCPFCGHDAADVLDGYKAYFGQMYKALKVALADLRGRVQAALGDPALMRVQRVVSDNQAAVEFWKQFVSFAPPEIDFERLSEVTVAFRSCAESCLDQKSGAVLDPVECGDDFLSAARAYEQAVAAAKEYNTGVAGVNVELNRRKEETEAAGLDAAQADLDRLCATRLRHTPAADRACQTHLEACAAKKKLDGQKKTAKAELDKYAEGIFENYSGEMNKILEAFSASFRIEKFTRSYAGGSPSSSYALVIDGTPVTVGDVKTGAGSPCFKNTLSAGDKSALALAFFLVRVRQDPRLAEKVVVFDDPITSQDISRTTCTRQIIYRLCQETLQVVVFSHNLFFLKHLHDETVRRDIRALQLRRDSEWSVVAEWDVERDTCGEYYQNYTALVEYVEKGTGDMRNVARCIRLLLEEYLRLKCPREFGRTEWLGDFIAKIRASGAGTPLHQARAVQAELEDINDFAKKYHHRENPGADGEPINDAELRGFVQRTLRLVGRF